MPNHFSAIFSLENRDLKIQLRARMRFGVGFLQPLDRHMRINLCGRKTGMSEQRLDAAKVRAAIEHVGGKTVSKFVRTDRNRNRRVP